MQDVVVLSGGEERCADVPDWSPGCTPTFVLPLIPDVVVDADAAAALDAQLLDTGGTE